MAESIKCPNCSASLRFDADAQQLVCDFCGASIDPDTITTNPDETISFTSREEPKSDADTWDDTESQAFICNSCGATVITDKNTTATFCAFCGSPAMITERLKETEKPEYVLPFQYSREQAVAKFFKWCKGGRFTPLDFVSEKNIEKLTGLYVPFWLFDTEGVLDIEGTGKTVSVSTSGNTTTTTTRYYHVVRKSEVKWALVPLDGASHIEDKYMESIEPFDYKNLELFDMKYMLGFYADRYDIKAEDLHARLTTRLKEYLNDELTDSTKAYDKVTKERDSSVIYEPVTHYALLPVWFMNYNYLGKQYRFIMNGQTGEIAGSVPVSRVKVIIACAVFLAIFGVIGRVIAGLILGGFVG
ncbi:MAG TPA: hypothetical protein PK567_06320 [Bacillota bacterium]|nr:hypothetical protein [Bacillota bacterium]